MNATSTLKSTSSTSKSLAPPASISAYLRYGLLGLPLAFLALPLYVLLPHHYAQNLGLPLTQVGLVLLLVRLADAGIEPFLGRLSHQLFQRTRRAVLQVLALLALLLVLGAVLLYFPLVTIGGSAGTAGLALWLALTLLLACAIHSFLGLQHQSWGLRLGGGDVTQSRIVASREGFALLGVMLASTLGLVYGAVMMLLCFAVTLTLGLFVLC